MHIRHVYLLVPVSCVLHKLILFVSTVTDNVRKAESSFSPVLEPEGSLMEPVQNFSKTKLTYHCRDVRLKHCVIVLAYNFCLSQTLVNECSFHLVIPMIVYFKFRNNLLVQFLVI